MTDMIALPGLEQKISSSPQENTLKIFLAFVQDQAAYVDSHTLDEYGAVLVSRDIKEKFKSLFPTGELDKTKLGTLIAAGPDMTSVGIMSAISSLFSTDDINKRVSKWILDIEYQIKIIISPQYSPFREFVSDAYDTYIAATPTPAPDPAPVIAPPKPPDWSAASGFLLAAAGILGAVSIIGVLRKKKQRRAW